MLNANPTAVYHLVARQCQSASDDLPDDHETSTAWSFERYLYFEAGRWPAGKTYEMQNSGSRGGNGGAVFTNCSCSCPSHGNFLQFGSRTLQGIVEASNSRLCTGKIGEPTIVEKMKRCSCVGVGKDPRWNSVT